ncbi:MAG: IS5 family transposase [Alphaproteobacteria bacterium]
MRFDLTDKQWASLQPLLPPTRQGGKQADDRKTINGILYVLKMGIPWGDLPSRYGPHTTCYNRLRRWQKTVYLAGSVSGTSSRISSHDLDDRQYEYKGTPGGSRGAKTGLSSDERVAAEAIGRSQGGRITKINAICDERGRLRRLLLTPGNRHDMIAVWEQMNDSPPDVQTFISDKGYYSQELREELEAAGLQVITPARGTDDGFREHEKELYKTRNLVERCFNTLKDNRRIATRCDKLASVFQSFICIAAIKQWILI